MQKVRSALLIGLLLIGVVLPTAADDGWNHHSQFARRNYWTDRNDYRDWYGYRYSHYRGNSCYLADRHYYHHDYYRYRPHYQDRVVVYSRSTGDYYKWIGGAILLGEVLHHSSD